jgi:glycosyltransferase involved in cell wall biosynthesis
VRRSAAIFAGNEETRNKLLELGAAPERVSLLSGAFFNLEDEAKFHFPSKNYEGRLELFAGGNLEGRKGVTVALKALRRVADAGVDFRYTLGGSGPEAAFVRELTASLGLNENVEFSEGFRGKDYCERLGSTHIFLMPSLRESAGLTLMEAMLAGCVPVVASGGGPGTIVTDACGFRINPVSEEHMEIEIAQRIIELSQTRSRLREMGGEARARIQDSYSEKHYQDLVFRLYEQLTTG